MLLDLIWSTTLRKAITSVIGGIVLVSGAIKATAEAWPYVEPLYPAHRVWVRELIKHESAPLIMVQNTQAVAIDRFLLYQTQKELESVKADPAASTSPTVKEKIQILEDQVKNTQERIQKATK